MSHNPITGDNLISKPATKAYLENWEKIFGNKHNREQSDTELAKDTSWQPEHSGQDTKTK